jgi:hypothetical protein
MNICETDVIFKSIREQKSIILLKLIWPKVYQKKSCLLYPTLL